MADECDVSKIVTTFLLNTCRLPQRLTEHDIQAAISCCMTAGKRPQDDEGAELIPLITGSVAEFYIEPMLPHVSDIDVMYYWNSMLAIPRGHPPPTQLPAEFHNYVKILEIIDSHLSGYVYLPLRYFHIRVTDGEKYNCVENMETNICPLKNFSCVNGHVHGPATFTPLSDPFLSIDAVPCIRCLVWPSQAADWPTRHRNYGWPDSATIHCVVSNGCDVVPAAHR